MTVCQSVVKLEINLQVLILFAFVHLLKIAYQKIILRILENLYCIGIIDIRHIKNHLQNLQDLVIQAHIHMIRSELKNLEQGSFLNHNLDHIVFYHQLINKLKTLHYQNNWWFHFLKNDNKNVVQKISLQYLKHQEWIQFLYVFLNKNNHLFKIFNKLLLFNTALQNLIHKNI